MEDPLIIVQGPDESNNKNNEGHILVLWRLSVFLGRAGRLRLQNPSMVFSATANLKPAEQVQAGVRDEYLPSRQPSGFNLLESFNNDPALGGVKPRLSALRVSRVIPATQVSKDLMRPLKNISRRSIKVVPAFSVRVRYARPSTTPSNPSIIASLDVDITPFAGLEIQLETVTFKVIGGVVEDLNNTQGMKLPMKCLPRDDVTFLYRVRPDDLDNTNNNIKPVQVFVTAKVTVSDICRPQISVRWQTSIDFTPPVNPGFGQPSQPIQRDHRPSQISLGSIDAVPSVIPLAISHPDALPSTELTTRHQRSTSVPDFGVTMTFTSTATPPNNIIKPGVPFAWEVFIVNRSDRPRKVALVVIPRRRRSDRLITNRPPSTGNGRIKDPKIADAVLDENILHAMQKHAAIEPTEIICFSTDVRVGPLAPSACHTIELRFMALRSGVIGLDAVRVIDLATQEHVDIIDLPSIVVSQA
jgi:TRAPP trafficking subunit Trs65